LSEKELERELTSLLSEPASTTESESRQRLERISTITAYLLLQAGKRIERSSLALLVMVVILASSLVSFLLIIAYLLGYISF
jgi:hypothetical protein